jgi:putative membrane protein
VFFAPIAAFAHEGEALEPHDLWHAWEFDPVVVALLVVSAAMYTLGVKRLWRKDAGASGPRGIRPWNIWCYAAGWLSLVVALVSPLHSMGSVLFSAHMTQHEVLMIVAAPLLVLGRPLVPYMWALPKSARRSFASFIRTATWRTLWKWVSSPLAAWTIHAVALWAWHIPALFQATIENETVHALQHFSFLGSALLFVWSLLRTYNGKRQYGAAVAYVFTTAVHTSLLGALLTFSTRVWYPVYQTTTAAWGYTPLEDQQLGGLIMWVPAGVLYTIAGLAFFAAWISESSNKTITTSREEPMYGA